MCYAAAIPWVVGALTVGTAVVSANNQRQEGKANAAIAEQNAKALNKQADAARAAGDRESELQLWRTRQQIGEQQAAQAASGIDTGYGTPVDILGETAMFGAIEQQDIRLRAAQQAYGFDANAVNERNRGAQTLWAGKQGAKATLLGGLASAGTGLYNAGAFSTGGGGNVNTGTAGLKKTNTTTKFY
jgi:hypothetical protein